MKVTNAYDYFISFKKRRCIFGWIRVSTYPTTIKVVDQDESAFS